MKQLKKAICFTKMVGCLMTVGIETCPAESRFLLCRDKAIKQHRSQIYPELTKMSGSGALRPTSPSSSMIGMTKRYSDMYTHHHFTELEQEHSNFYKINLRWYIHILYDLSRTLVISKYQMYGIV